jgi:hypothetical protein
MTPQEKELISQLLERLKQAGGQPKDPEAESLIKGAVAAQPDAPYLLTQTVLIQNMTLDTAQARITELERQLADAKAAAARPSSFLGGQPGAQPQGAPAPGAPWSQPPGAPVPPPAAPWGQRPGGPPPSYGQPMAAAPPPGYGQPMAAPPPAAGGGGSFLRTAAAAAAGVAGGALLYQGISSMFGSRGGPQVAGGTGMPGSTSMMPSDATRGSAAEQQNLPPGQQSGGPWQDGEQGGDRADDQADNGQQAGSTWNDDDQDDGDSGGDDGGDFGGDDGGDFGGDSSDV